METAKLFEILNKAMSCWNVYCKYCDRFSHAKEPETADYYCNEANEIHAKYRTYLDCYEILTDRSVTGLSQLEEEIRLISDQL